MYSDAISAHASATELVNNCGPGCSSRFPRATRGPVTSVRLPLADNPS